MRILLLAAGALACGEATAPAAAGPFEGTLAIAGAERAYLGWVGAAIPADAGYPVVLAFHGAGGSAAIFRGVTGLEALADSLGLIVVHLDGLDAQWETSGAADTQFVRVLLDTLAARYPLDQTRLVATGFSNGGGFAQRLACEMTHRFAGIVAVGSALSRARAASCAPTGITRVRYVVGTNDQATPPEGSATVFPPDEAAAFWAGLNACRTGPITTVLTDRNSDDQRPTRMAWSGCDQGAQVDLFVVPEGLHLWDMSADVRTADLVAGILP